MIPDIVVWIIIGIVAVAALAALIVLIIKIAKMNPEDRKELIISFLVGLVTTAEAAYTESGMGQQKVKDVEEAFKAKAPWFLKLLLLITKTADLNELIEKALEKAKATWAK